MTTFTTQVAALALAALATLSIVAGTNALATSQYAAADAQEMARYGQAHVAVQRVTVVGHRATA